MTPCNGCGRMIEFVPTAAGKKMPCELAPLVVVPAVDGDLKVLLEGKVVTARASRGGEPSEVAARVPHWPKCERADSFRKVRR